VSTSTPPQPGGQALPLLRQFARRRAPSEHCELCNLELAPQHEHLLELAQGKLLCACTACAILFSDQQLRYRRVPRRIMELIDFSLTDALWESLYLPIDLAFFVPKSATGKVIALYPSPAGATESQLPLEAWQDLVAANPILRELEPDVTALLVNRIGPQRSYFLAPIDECYKLVGLIRTHWRGLSGGTEVWKELAKFYASLRERSTTVGGADHA
jgi:hypothetical protein